MEVGAGAGRLCLPLARLVREVVALEPDPAMADALVADASAFDIPLIRVVRSRWQDYSAPVTDGVFAAHLVYAMPNIENFLSRVQRFASRWCGIILFAQPPQSQLADCWPAVL